MPRPHEEAWTAADGGCVIEGEHIATFWGATSVADPRAVLAAAAPEMARVLLTVRSTILRAPCNEEEATLRGWLDDALAKAGVPLP